MISSDFPGRLAFPPQTAAETARSVLATTAAEQSTGASDPRKCVVIMPVGGSIEPGCETALRKLEEQGYAVWRVRGYSQIDQARNDLASDALAAGFEETFWIDSDVVFQPEDVARLRAHNLPLVCGIYPKKGRREFALHTLPGTQSLVFGAGGGLAEIRYAATGFLLVRREVYAAIQEKLKLPVCNETFGKALVPYFMPCVHHDADRGPWYLSEDFAFCERARQAGFAIMADTSLRLWHVGSYAYSWEDAGSELKRFARYEYHFTPPKG